MASRERLHTERPAAAVSMLELSCGAFLLSPWPHWCVVEWSLHMGLVFLRTTFHKSKTHWKPPIIVWPTQRCILLLDVLLSCLTASCSSLCSLRSHSPSNSPARSPEFEGGGGFSRYYLIKIATLSGNFFLPHSNPQWRLSCLRLELRFWGQTDLSSEPNPTLRWGNLSKTTPLTSVSLSSRMC